MDGQPIAVNAWPALMSLDLASRYLSTDEGTFSSLIEDYRIETVELRPGVLRWRKIDLDRLQRRLPTKVVQASRAKHAAPAIGDADLERLAKAIARHLDGVRRAPSAELVSIKDTSSLLGLGKTTLYAMIKEGRLQTRQIGNRRLVLRSSIDTLMTGP